MDKKPLRIAISVSKEEYDKIKVMAGIASLSAYVRSRIFSKEEETMKDISLKEWVEFLLLVPDRDKILKQFIKDEGKNVGLFFKRVLPYGFGD